MSEYDDESVYLADAEPHLPEPFRASADLRARLVLHTLFAETLVLGDSQSLNNPYLRMLLTAGPQQRPHDLAALVEGGLLRLARRSAVPSFRAIRDEHAQRGVDNVPPPEYADWLDEITAGKLVSYDGADVAARFKDGLVALLDIEVARATGRSEQVLRAARDWVTGQKSLFYKSLRDWKDAYPDRSGPALLALQTVEECTSLAYRSALPSALGAAVADRRSVLRVTLGDRADHELRLPSTLLVPGALSRVPVEVLLETVRLPSRKVALTALSKIRHRIPVGTELLDGLTDFAETFHQRAMESFTTSDRQALNALRWHEVQLRCRSTTSGYGGQGVALDVTGAEGEPVRGFFELFTQASPLGDDVQPVSPVIEAEEEAEEEQDSISRAIMATAA